MRSMMRMNKLHDVEISCWPASGSSGSASVSRSVKSHGEYLRRLARLRVGHTGQQPEGCPGEVRRHGNIVTCCASEELSMWVVSTWRSRVALRWADGHRCSLLIRRFDEGSTAGDLSRTGHQIAGQREIAGCHSFLEESNCWSCISVTLCSCPLV